MSRSAVFERRSGVLFSFSVAAMLMVMSGLEMVMCRSVMARGGREMVFGRRMLCSSHCRSLWFRNFIDPDYWSFSAKLFNRR
jgi:hypothetical protein